MLQYVQEDAEFYGVEFDSDFTLASFGGGDLSAGVWGDYIRGELDSGDDIPRLPPMRIGGRLAWATDNIEIWTRVVDADEQDKPGANEEPTDGYTKWATGVAHLVSLQAAFQSSCSLFHDSDSLFNVDVAAPISSLLVGL